MITVTNGSQTITVTKGAFRNVFAPLGYHPIDAQTDPVECSVVEDEITGLEGENSAEETQEAEEETVEPEVEAEVETEEEDEDEKPLSEMTLSELKKVAHELGIPANGLRSKQEAIEAINKAK